jgi:hypothetical protein
MRKITLTLLAGAMVLIAPAEAADVTDGYVKGTDLLEFCEDRGRPMYTFCLGYVVGVAEMSRQDDEWCPRRGTDNRQLVEIVVRWLREFPSMRHVPAISLVGAALGDSLPCP